MSDEEPQPRSVAEWIDCLFGDDGFWSWQAASALGRIATQQPASLPVIMPAVFRALAEPDLGLRRWAVDLLAAIHKAPVVHLEQQRVVAALRAVTNEPDRDLRFAAAALLAGLGQRAAAKPVFAEVLAQPEEHVGQTTVVYRWLSEWGPAVQEFVPVLKEHMRTLSMSTAGMAGLALNKIIGAELIPFLTELLDSPAADARWAAVELLVTWDDTAAGRLPRLLAVLKRDPDERVRAWTALRLGRLNPRQQTVTAALRAAMRDRAMEVRINAAASLLTRDPANAEAQAILRKALEQPRVHEQYLAVRALGLNPCDPGALAGLIASLARILARTRITDVTSLDESTQLVKLAADCMAKIGAAAVPSLVAILRSPDLLPHYRAVAALERIGMAAREAAPWLMRIVDNKAKYDEAGKEMGILCGVVLTPNTAICALANNITPDDKQAIPYLVAALNNEVESVRQFARAGLARIGWQAPGTEKGHADI